MEFSFSNTKTSGQFIVRSEKFSRAIIVKFSEFAYDIPIDSWIFDEMVVYAAALANTKGWKTVNIQRVEIKPHYLDGYGSVDEFHAYNNNDFKNSETYWGEPIGRFGQITYFE